MWKSGVSVYGSKIFGVFALLGLGVAGCGDDGGGSGSSQATGGSTQMGTVPSGGGGTNAVGGNSASTSAVGGGHQGALGGNTSQGTSTVPQASAVTNLPSTATVTYSSTSAGQGLALVSFNLVPKQSSTLNYIELFAEVKNDNTKTICFPQIDFSLKDSSGLVLWSDLTFAYTLPYLSTSNLATSCLAPGESGVFWSNELPASPILVSSVASMTIEYDGLDMTATKFGQTMTSSVVTDSIYMDGKHWSFNGSLTPSQTIYNVGIDAFAKSSSGLITGHLSDTNLGTILASSPWQFGSEVGIEGVKPTQFFVFDGFIIGSSASALGLSRVPSIVVEPELNAVVNAARTSRQRVQERWNTAQLPQ